METMEMEMIQEGMAIENENNTTRHYDIIDIDYEYDLLEYNRCIKSIAINDEKLYVAGERVVIKKSISGSYYFLLKNKLVRGALRNALLWKLLELRSPKWRTEEPVTDLPQLLIYKSVNNKTLDTMYIWYSKTSGRVVMIYLNENGEKEMIKQMKKVQYRRLREEIPLRRIKPVIKEENEIYRHNEPEWFIERTEELEDLLQLLYDLKLRRISTDERDLLRSIKEELEGFDL